ncbi:hypothetical protein LIER_08288 [Lithospermum erythrorhizon]|uniref:DUF4283 domain-containing protein n=1 Tax=Lithospermum erythrorhizon TaxID=34254 RepID=A0AAV3PCQ0_LITER
MDVDSALQNRAILSRTRLGYFLDIRQFTVGRVQDYVENNLSLRENVQVDRRESNFLFTFQNIDDMDFVVQHAPYNVNGALLLVDH